MYNIVYACKMLPIQYKYFVTECKLYNYECNLVMCLGHLDEADSIFSYGDQNYSSLNNGYQDFVPTFFDELNVTQEVLDACGDNLACQLDASLTDNLDIGMTTLNTAKENEELEDILGK